MCVKWARDILLLLMDNEISSIVCVCVDECDLECDQTPNANETLHKGASARNSGRQYCLNRLQMAAI